MFKTCYKKAMKRPRLIVGILAAVHLVLAGMVSFSHKSPSAVDLSSAGAFFLMLLPSQGNLVGIWTALGSKGTPFRVMLIVVAFVIGCHNRQSIDLGIAFELFLVQMLNVTAVLLILRLTGLELKLPPVEPWHPRPFQFTIGQMMEWTATLAVAMSAFHYLPNGFPYSDIPSYAIHLSCTAVALASLWLVFGKRWLPLRFLIIVGAIGGGTVLLQRMVGFFSLSDFGYLLASQAAWTILSLLVIRWAGYRMTWHWRLRQFKELAR
jgi:hypothetical protein